MELKPKVGIRSKVDLVKSKLDGIDHTLNNIFKQLDSHSNLEFKRKVNEYLKWVKKEFIIINRERRYSNSEILKRISNYELMLQKDSNVSIVLSPLIINAVLENSDIVKIDQAYYHFLKHGPLFFHKIVDPFRLWLDKFNLREILTKNEPNILSYALIAVLSRFTLPHNSICYKQIYGKSLKGIKATLPQSYSNPSYNCVVALGLLSYISLSHSNYDLTKRYFLDAVRMAQCLGYDINNSLFNTIDVTFTRYNKLFEGNNIWKTLHLTYIVLSASIPDMPFIKFEVKDPLPFTIENQSKRDNEIDYKAVSELPYVYIQDYIDVKVKITTHIQKVKETYKSIKDYSKLPIDALILPQNEFTNCLGMLKNLIQDQKLIRDESHYTRKELNERTNSYEFNFKRYLKVLIQHVSIILYYPCIMIYPQPVHFEKSKLKLLFHYSNQVITYCLNIGLNKKLKSKKFTRIRQFGPKLPFQSNISIPFYYQMCYPFFALTNLLHHTSNLCEEDRLLFNESKIKCVLLVQELYNVSKSNDKRHAKDSNNALNQIKYCIHRFQLPSDLIEKISIYLN